MGRRIFAEKNFNVVGKVVPYDQFRMCIDRPEGFKINPEHYPAIIERAEAVFEKEYPILPATDYMMYKRDGNRTIFEGKYFMRRNDLLTLALAEYVDKKGRYLDKVINLLWMILEETTWVLPAHNLAKEGVNTCLPYAFKDDADYIDLFAGTTGAALACVYYLLKDELDEVTTIITERILYELDTRIIKPFTNIAHVWDHMWWTGVKGNRVNNWCPWVVSNVLTVCALTVKDMPTREAIVNACLPMLDNFTSVYKTDGGCDEGPGYWDAAGAALFNACIILYDMTNGYVNIYDDPLFKNMGEYEVKVCVHGKRFLNFADTPGIVSPSPIMIYEWGALTGSEMMMSYGQSRLAGNLIGPVIGSGQPYRSFRFLTEPRLPVAEFKAPKKFWLDGIIIAGTRETDDTSKGLYLAFKGGNNGESHNHNDVGNIIVFSNGQPIFIDVGKGKYTRRTFSAERYDIWAMNSDFHNTATVNGFTEAKGKGAFSTEHVYDEETGKLTMELKKAYPKEAGIASYKRSAELKDSVVTVTDDIKLENEGTVTFNFMVETKPEEIGEGYFMIRDRKVTFDPELEYGIDVCDNSLEETETIPRNWGVEYLYRITLKSKNSFKEKKFVLTVE